MAEVTAPCPRCSQAVRMQVSRRASESALVATALAQHGVFGRRQAIACGFSPGAIKRRVAAGHWKRVIPGVYAYSGTPVTWEGRLMAACLWGGEGSAASYRAAARMWGFAGFGSAPIEISTVHWKSPPGVAFKAHRMDRFLLNDIVTVAGVPTTSVRRTLLDLAGSRARYTSSSLD